MDKLLLSCFKLVRLFAHWKKCENTDTNKQFPKIYMTNLSLFTSGKPLEEKLTRTSLGNSTYLLTLPAACLSAVSFARKKTNDWKIMPKPTKPCQSCEGGLVWESGLIWEVDVVWLSRIMKSCYNSLFGKAGKICYFKNFSLRTFDQKLLFSIKC